MSTSDVRHIGGTPVAWTLTPDAEEAEAAREHDQQTRFPDLVAFACLALPALTVPRLGLPLNECSMAAICLWSVSRRPDAGVRLPRWLVGGLGLVLALLVVISLTHDLTPARRLLHVALYCTLAVLLTSGRIHAPSAARGMVLGLVAAVAGSLAGLQPQGYGDRLSGLLGDPNNAGYVLTTLGFVSIGVLRWRGLSRVLVLVVPVAVVLTYSRTALLALVLAILWGLLGRRIGPFVGVGVIGAAIYLIANIPPQLKVFGPFSDRTGSDALRERIIVQEHIDINAAPWFGSGAGTARVGLDGNTFFYHSSYFALQREGGLVTLLVLLGVVALLAVASIRLLSSERNPWLEAGIICALMCAVNLGEVLLELPTAVALGLVAHHLVRARLEPEPDPEQAPGDDLGGAPERVPGPVAWVRP